MKKRSVAEASSAAHLLQVANYLSRPQQFMAVAEARAGLRQALEDASRCSIVLTNNGQPQAAIVPFQTLEAMRSALLQLLVGGMQASFERVQKELSVQLAQPDNGRKPSEATSEEELESLVNEARRRQAKTDSAKRRKKSR